MHTVYYTFCRCKKQGAAGPSSTKRLQTLLRRPLRESGAPPRARSGRTTPAETNAPKYISEGSLRNKELPLVLLFPVLIYILPLAALFFPSGKNEESGSGTAPAPSASAPPVTDGTQAPSAPQPGTSAADDAEPPLLILDENTGEVAEVSVRDFVRGAVAAEMPMTYPDEALRAQAVAAHSYALAVKAQADPDNEALKGAYFSANPTQRLGYITDTVMRAMWGEDYEANRTRLYTVVDSVLDEILLYDGQPAMACYHAISGGKTEAAEAVWGAAVPYLVSVDSPLDLTSPDYEQTITVTKQEVAEDIAAAFPDIVLEGDAAGWFGTPQLTAAGYVDSITIGGVPCKGTAVRAALRLRSASFTITWTEKHLFEITTRGYGHGVGLSQYGANALALTGKSYQEILSLYYPGTTLGPAPR